MAQGSVSPKHSYHPGYEKYPHPKEGKNLCHPSDLLATANLMKTLHLGAEGSHWCYHHNPFFDSIIFHNED